LVDSGNLSPFILNSTYYFNFTESQGKYVVKLCDGSTKIIINLGEDNMLWIIIVLPILIGIALMYWGSQLEEDNILKLVFQLLLLPLAFININYSITIIGYLYPQLTSLIDGLGDLVYYLGWVLFIVGGVMLLRILLKLKDYLLNKKEKRESEKYD